MVWLAAFFCIPILLIAVYSVSIRTSGGGIQPAFTLQSYRHILTSSYYLGIIWQTLVVSVKVTLICLVVSYPVAYWLAAAAPRWKSVLLLLLLVPWWTSILVKNFAWVDILQERGMVNAALAWLGVLHHPLRMLYSDFSVEVGLVHLLIPFMILPLFATLDKLEVQLLEAAENLGAAPLAAFWEVTLPLSLPGIASGAILTFILAFGSFVIPALLGGSGNWMVALAIQDQFLNAFNWPLGSALAIVVLLIVLVLVLIFNRLVGLERIWGEHRERPRSLPAESPP